MKTYYFDICGDAQGYFRDEVGEVLDDDAAAWREALVQARSIEDALAPGGPWRMRVREDDRLVFELDVTSRWIDPPTVVAPSIVGSECASKFELLQLLFPNRGKVSQ